MANKKLRVYGWTEYHLNGVAKAQFNHSFRCVCAASSKAEVARIMGETSIARLPDIDRTEDVEEVAVATAKPGAVFYTLDGAHRTNRTYAEYTKPGASE